MRNGFVLLVAAILSVHSVAAQEPGLWNSRGSSDFVGTVYDVDYASARTQVLIRPAGNPMGPNLVGFVKSETIQDVLQSSLVASRPVLVTHYDQNVVRALLVQTPAVCSEPGCVSEIDCSDFGCTAVVIGQAGSVGVPNRRALGILLTAINDRSRVEELIVDENRNITRVKVNVPGPELQRK